MDLKSFTAAMFLMLAFAAIILPTGKKKDVLPESTAWAVTSTQCPNPACECKDCQCDPCECVKESEATDTRNWVYIFTTDNCPPCEYMKRTELPRLKAAGYRVAFMPENDPKFSKFYEYYRPSGGFPQVIVVDHEGKVVKRFAAGRVVTEQIIGQSVLEKTTVQPIYTEPTYQVQRPQRTGWFRRRSVSACGPGGCR